jgi:predicted Zn-dependent peptidase
MNDFQKIQDILGVPVYYQELPEFVKNSSVALVVFTGSADDMTAGNKGLYHWFEHVPFRGTKKYPDGPSSAISKAGGIRGAYTSRQLTEYWSKVPTRNLEVAISVVVDLVANPLLRPDDIDAERRIIEEEIGESLGKPAHTAFWQAESVIWSGHPFGNKVLGDIESLNSMTSETLIKAREMGYDKSRMTFFISTSAPISMVEKILLDHFADLPSFGLSPRTKAGSFGEMKWIPGTTNVFSSRAESSRIKVLFPNPTPKDFKGLARRAILGKILTHGSTDSPLYKELRKNRQLVYSVGISKFLSPDGDYFGFEAETSQVKEAERALRVMLRDPRLYSKDWINEVKEVIRIEEEMRSIASDADIDSAISLVTLMGQIIPEEEMLQMINDTPFEEVVEIVAKMATFEEARTFIFEGNK